MAGSLDGLTVIDLTQGIAGPVTGMVLAEQGADVVKVEPPGGDPYRDILAGYLVWNRSKRSATLDLESVSGREALAALLSRADVLVESYDPGVTARLGMDHSALNSRHPHLVHCSISGYGYDHPMKDRPGIDALVMAAMGVPYEQLGHRDGPIFITSPWQATAQPSRPSSASRRRCGRVCTPAGGSGLKRPSMTGLPS